MAMRPQLATAHDDPSTASAARQFGEGRLPSIREFLSFTLGEEAYGIDILRVKEIRSYERPTQLANAPDFLKGVINLRGVIVPIVDMRVRFRLPRVSYDSFTVVIVLSLGPREVGMVVDSVSDVITFGPEQLHAVPEFSSSVDSEHLLALGSSAGRTVILLDIEKLMASTGMGLANTTLH
jgi:purine-binding chemotaxis protein CheW